VELEDEAVAEAEAAAAGAAPEPLLSEVETELDTEDEAAPAGAAPEPFLPEVETELDAAGATEDTVSVGDEEDPTPGFWVRSTNWVPSAMGPEGLAAHDPAGLRGVVCPKGIVPAPPTATPPTKVVAEDPWNWHWNRPFNSLFAGAVWQ
jgi:hypothetical protein